MSYQYNDYDDYRDGYWEMPAPQPQRQQPSRPSPDKLIAAVRNNDLARATTLIRSRADVNQGFQSTFPLLAAVEANNLQMVIFLLNVKAKVSQNSNICLRTAALKGFHDIAKELFSRGAAIHPSVLYAQGVYPTGREEDLRALWPYRTRGGGDQNLFVYARSLTSEKYDEHYKFDSMFLILKACEPEVLNEPFEKDTTPLQLAMRLPTTWLLHALVKNGVDVNKVQSDGNTALHYARNRLQVEYLVDARADVNARSCATFTPLMSAARTGFVGVVDALIHARADVNLTDRHNRKAISMAGNSEVWDLLETEARKVQSQLGKLRSKANLALKTASLRSKELVQAARDIDSLKGQASAIQNKLSTAEASLGDLQRAVAAANAASTHAANVYEAARTGRPAPPPPAPIPATASASASSAGASASSADVRQACEAMARDGECRVANCRLQHEPCERHMSKFGSCTVAHCTGVHPHAEVYRRFVTCSICMDRCGGMTTQLPCKHTFDFACLVTFLRANPNQTCPNCRAPVGAGAEALRR
jgi:ankyrin repeat protein